MPEILVVGSLHADLVFRAPRFSQPGAAASDGAQVSMLGYVGNNSIGVFLLDNLKLSSVDFFTS